MKIPKNAIELGTGWLTWEREERMTDRYGTVRLMDGGQMSKPIPIQKLEEGQQGALLVVITQARPSTHMGDPARGLTPTTPKVGEVIQLGWGKLFYQTDGWGATHVGLRPEPARAKDWLDPRSLFRCHHQTVILYFCPAQWGAR